uniref:LD27504p n=1 Tax=Drosophila melanogaster TaxID=7227 RepID=Q95T14_DROME|nr:LD27504p [Drosophila melanogaster]
MVLWPLGVASLSHSSSIVVTAATSNSIPAKGAHRIASHRIDPLIDHREISAQLPSLPLHLVHQLEQQQQQTTIIIKFINYNDNRTTAAADCRRFHLESCKMHTIHITFRYRYRYTCSCD